MFIHFLNMDNFAINLHDGPALAAEFPDATAQPIGGCSGPWLSVALMASDCCNGLRSWWSWPLKVHACRGGAQQELLMAQPARNSLISPPLPQRLPVPVLQMLRDGPGPHSSLQWPAVTVSVEGLSDEFSCRFNYAAIHSLTHSISQSVQALHLQKINMSAHRKYT